MNELEKSNTNKPNNMLNNLSLISSRVKMLTDIAVILEGRYNDSDNNIDDQCKELFSTLLSVRGNVDAIRNYLKEQEDQTNSLKVSYVLPVFKCIRGICLHIFLFSRNT